MTCLTMRRPSSRSGIILAGLAAALLLPGTAGAKESFVRTISSHLGLSYQPPCRLCHIQGTTGAGTLQTPFAESMLAHGLTQDKGSVTPALDGLATDQTDSDGDGVPDIAELRANTDPNTPLPVALDTSGPSYGCVVAGPEEHRGRSTAALALALAWAGWRRRARGRGDRAPRRSPLT